MNTASRGGQKSGMQELTGTEFYYDGTLDELAKNGFRIRRRRHSSAGRAADL
ncbi:MAG TPA: hypothetical protein VLQ29_10930 [Candidatus Dormibacteraeota bacterium]|jgi:hypothetical protein|nr:hypothetical protein [Candidatus Dormibacteraeota bacterium]